MSEELSSSPPKNRNRRPKCRRSSLEPKFGVAVIFGRQDKTFQTLPSPAFVSGRTQTCGVVDKTRVSGPLSPPNLLPYYTWREGGNLLNQTGNLLFFKVIRLLNGALKTIVYVGERQWFSLCSSASTVRSFRALKRPYILFFLPEGTWGTESPASLPPEFGWVYCDCPYILSRVQRSGNQTSSVFCTCSIHTTYIHTITSWFSLYLFIVCGTNCVLREFFLLRHLRLSVFTQIHLL